MGGYLAQIDAAEPAARWPMVRNWLFAEPLPLFSELREERPVLVLPELTFVTRYADCDTILRRYDAFGVDLYKPKQGGYWMAQDDTAEHWREKSIMRAVLDREDVPAMRDFVGQKASELLRAAGGAMEVVAGLTRAVPVALVQQFFGYAMANPKLLIDWSYWNQADAFHNQPFDTITVPDPAHIVHMRELSDIALAAYLGTLVAERSLEVKAGIQRDDPVSRLLRLSFTGALKFDALRVISNVGGLLIGAVETTSHCAVNALQELFIRPEVLAEARAAALDPKVFDGFVFECLRFRPAFPYFFRTCHIPITLCAGSEFAHEIQAGTTVLAVTHSAMFDPAIYTRPELFDPSRPTGDSFTFGRGLHECLGRAIGAAMIPEIVRQCLLMPDLKPVCPPAYELGVPENYNLIWSA
jgi:cytochrome P450